MTGIQKLSVALLLNSAFLTQYANAENIKIQPFLASPEHFGVTSTLIETDKDVMLVNAQFSKSEALRIAANILDSGKQLKTIFVSYGDPDYYFGLDVLKQIFPKAQIIATPETVKHIEKTYQLKQKYWSPQMGENAPSKIIIPQPYTAKEINFDGLNIQIQGKKELTYLWIPSIKAVIGGIPVSSGIHLWMADTATASSRKEVLTTLQNIKELMPKIVIPAHMASGAVENMPAVDFSIQYLEQYEKAVQKTKSANELIAEMKTIYPKLHEVNSLELGAKVVKGEMKWP
ncbi:MBL fold metallo-hydrolase [Acinetobacter nectaris]|uniref:MBL fold metallo-hydrolase n=1 Tax=Acinetobacter nectaris TaxID=1219382 RepID=UPI001F3A16B1|nr:MBL fold metallo-hydrolase [Acinetobacter nectaris]